MSAIYSAAFRDQDPLFEMSDDDPFSYIPLRVSKRRKRMPQGCQKRKMRKNEEVDVKEETKDGIVEIFAGSQRRDSLLEETPSGYILMLFSEYKKTWNNCFVS